MDKQEELIDSEGRSKDKKKSKSYYENRAIIYVVCMLGGGLVYAAFFTNPRINFFIDSLLYTLVAFVTAIPIEVYRKYRRDKKNKKRGIEIEDDPLWFHIVESALSLLILVLILSFLIFKKG